MSCTLRVYSQDSLTWLHLANSFINNQTLLLCQWKYLKQLVSISKELHNVFHNAAGHGSAARGRKPVELQTRSSCKWTTIEKKLVCMSSNCFSIKQHSHQPQQRWLKWPIPMISVCKCAFRASAFKTLPSGIWSWCMDGVPVNSRKCQNVKIHLGEEN